MQNKLIRDFIDYYSIEVSEKSLVDFEKIVKIKKLSKGEKFIKNNEVQTEFYILGKGIVRSYTIDDSGREHINMLYTPITACGALSGLLDKKEPDLFFDCLTDCLFLKGNYQEMLNLICNNIELNKLYIKVLELGFIKSEARIGDLSVLNATERYLRLKKQIPNVDNLIQQYHIASYLNVTPVQLSRIRKKIYSK